MAYYCLVKEYKLLTEFLYVTCSPYYITHLFIYKVNIKNISDRNQNYKHLPMPTDFSNVSFSESFLQIIKSNFFS